jgi:hypothetical protein
MCGQDAEVMGARVWVGILMHPPGAGQGSWPRYVASNAAFILSTSSSDAVARRAGEDDSPLRSYPLEKV